MYETIDLYFTSNGDLALNYYNDLQDTQDDPYRSLKQQIATKSQATKGDWALYPDLGANLNELIGSMNNQDTANQAIEQLGDELTTDLLDPAHLKVQATPLDKDALGMIAAVRVGPLEADVVVCPVIFNLDMGVFA